jgi:transposase-like protein
LEKEKPPVFGMIQRGGRVLLRMLANVQRKTIKPIIERAIAKGTLVFTDEYEIYGNLKRMGYEHKTVCHSKGEYARDEDGDGFYEVHVNTMEGVWSLLRSWLRPHRGISQEHLPYYIGFFEFVHNTRARGKSLLKTCYRYSCHHPASQHEPRFYETGSPAFRSFAVWVLTTEINFVFDKCFADRVLRKFPTVSSDFLLLIILKNIVFN